MGGKITKALKKKNTDSISLNVLNYIKSVVLRCVCYWSSSTKKSVKSQLNLVHMIFTLLGPHIQLESCIRSNLDGAVGYIAIHQLRM